MTKPIRIQLRRTKGWRLDKTSLALNGLPAVRVARPSIWGNPFCPASDAHDFQSKIITQPPCFCLVDSWWEPAGVVQMYRQWLTGVEIRDAETDEVIDSDVLPKPPSLSLLWKLRGKNLACWCPLDRPCHADVLLELANET